MKKLIALALSCATLALIIMPGVFADTQNTDTDVNVSGGTPVFTLQLGNRHQAIAFGGGNDPFTGGDANSSDPDGFTHNDVGTGDTITFDHGTDINYDDVLYVVDNNATVGTQGHYIEVALDLTEDPNNLGTYYDDLVYDNTFASQPDLSNTGDANANVNSYSISYDDHFDEAVELANITSTAVDANACQVDESQVEMFGVYLTAMPALMVQSTEECAGNSYYTMASSTFIGPSNGISQGNYGITGTATLFDGAVPSI